MLALASRGADVVVNYLRNAEAAEATADQARALGVQAVALRGHVGDSEKVDALFTAIKDRFGTLDILVNNAASGVIRPLLELEPRHWDWTQDINTRGAWLCAKAAAALMAGRGGRIVNLSSLGAGRVLKNYAAVGVSKGRPRGAHPLPGS